MRLRTITIKAFGRLSQVDLTLAPDLNLIYGLNEAGKSTLFHAITSLLMGFSPAKGEGHPYMPWDKESIDIEGDFIHEDEQWHVQRTLKSAPSGAYFDGKNKERLGNQALPFAQFLSKEMFANLFTLHLQNLNGEVLRGKCWQEIKEYFLYTVSQETHVSPSKVLNQVEMERNALLRGDNRGQQRIKILAKEIKEKHAELKQMEQAYARYEEKQNRLSERRRHLVTLKSEIAEKRERHDKIGRLLPYLQIEERIQAAKKQLGGLDLFKLRTALALEKQRSICEEEALRLKTQLDVLDEDLETLNRQLEVAEVVPDQVLKDKSAAYALAARADQLVRQEHTVEAWKAEALALDEQIQQSYMQTFRRPYKAAMLHEIEALDLSSIADTIAAVQASKKQLESQNDIALPALWPLWLPLLLIAVLGLTAAWMNWNITLPIIGLTIGLMLSALYGFVRISRTQTVQKNAAENNQQCTQTIEHHIAILSKALSAFDLSKDSITQLDDGFIQGLIQLKTLISRKPRIEASILQADNEKNTFEEARTAFYIQHGMTFESALTHFDRWETLQKEQMAVRDRCVYLSHQRDKVTHQLKELENRSHQLASEITVKVGTPVMDFSGSAPHFERVLERIDTYIAERELLGDIAVLSTDLDALDFETLKHEMEQLNEAVSALSNEETDVYGEVRALMTECDHIKEGDQYPELATELLELEQSLIEAKAQYRLLNAFLALIKLTDEQIQSLYQPEYLRKASLYFAQITGGRYTDILISETDQVLLKLSGSEMPIEKLDALSAGTLNQLYFSLYLSLVEQIDPSATLPLLLDDVFLNWDEKRFNEALALLRKIAEVRQVFYLSCSQTAMDRCVQVLNITPIQLTD